MARFFAVLIVAIASLATTPRADAQVLDPGMLITALAPERTGPIVRSIQANGSANFALDQPLPPGLDLPTVDVNVDFVDENHMLTTAGMTALRSVAVALSDPKLAGSRFQVAGHFTSPGAPAESQRASYRRAAVAREHLIAFYGLDPARLVPVGYGQSQPRDQVNYASPVNNRIAFINFDALN